MRSKEFQKQGKLLWNACTMIVVLVWMQTPLYKLNNYLQNQTPGKETSTLIYSTLLKLPIYKNKQNEKERYKNIIHYKNTMKYTLNTMTIIRTIKYQSYSVKSICSPTQGITLQAALWIQWNLCQTEKFASCFVIQDIFQVLTSLIT